MLPILLCGGLLELLYLLILTLTPIPGLHLSSTPLSTAWSWTLLPSQTLFAGAWNSANSTLAHSWPYILLLSMALVAVTAVYAFAIWLVLRVRSISSNMNSWLLVLLGGALLFGLTLLLQPTLFSDDVFTYIFSGRMLAIYHADPLNTAPIQFPGDPYLHWVVSGRYTPNIYGPLWLCIASILVSVGNIGSIGGGPVMTLLLFKGVALLAHLLNCALVWAILSKLAPPRRILGTLLYAWNPLALIELAGSGHNEGLLLSVLLLTILLYVHGKRRGNELGVLVLLGLAISMNLIVLLIAPLFTWFMVRTERDMRHALWGFCWRTLLGQGLVIPLYLPFWRGAPTFFAITSAMDMKHFVHSPIGLLTVPARWVFGLVDIWSHFPPVMQPTISADVTLRASALFIFVLIYMRLFGKVRRATTTIAGMHYAAASDQTMTLPGFDVLLTCWSIAVFWYLVLVMSWFWPWYVLWALWIVVLRRFDMRTTTLLLLAGTSLLIYPLLSLGEFALAVYQPLLIFGIPLVYLFVKRQKQAEVV
ncbi:MAG: hypothetical protein NVSMB27_08540 [Ktedonobacteraceae bacterium]